MSHIFNQVGVFYFSDQNYDEVADYMGVIIVLPKPFEHEVELSATSFNPGALLSVWR